MTLATSILFAGLAVAGKVGSNYYDFMSSPRDDEVGFVETLNIGMAIAYATLGFVVSAIFSFAWSYYEFRFSPLRDAPGFGPKSFVYGMFYLHNI